MPGAAFLSGDRLALHAVADDDHEFLHEHWNRPGIRHGFARYRPRRPSDFAAFLDREDVVPFLVCADEYGESTDNEVGRRPRSGQPTGFLWLFGVEDVFERAELGYWVRADEQGQGYATEAVELGLRYAFGERDLHKVSARVFESNDASRRVLEKTRFERKGTLREHYFVDGERVDAGLYAAFAGDR